jgi:hypothetical protein
LCCRFEGAEAAHSIIAAGPEPLQSQFTTSYSLVLNLLSVYSLEEARDFLRWGAKFRAGSSWLEVQGGKFMRVRHLCWEDWCLYRACYSILLYGDGQLSESMAEPA